jgi:hypothetical protein
VYDVHHTPQVKTLFSLVLLLSASLSRPDIALKEAQRAARDITRATGIRFRIHHTIVDPLPYQDSGPYFETAYSYFHRVPWPVSKSRALFLFLVPAEMNNAGQDVPNGAASQCGIHSTPYAFASVVHGSIALGAPDYSSRITRYVIEHELLHVLGASHTRRVSVMSAGNFAYISPLQRKLKILEVTKRQLAACLK